MTCFEELFLYNSELFLGNISVCPHFLQLFRFNDWSEFANIGHEGSFGPKTDNIYMVGCESLQMISESILDLGVGVCLAP